MPLLRRGRIMLSKPSFQCGIWRCAENKLSKLSSGASLYIHRHCGKQTLSDLRCGAHLQKGHADGWDGLLRMVSHMWGEGMVHQSRLEHAWILHCQPP